MTEEPIAVSSATHRMRMDLQGRLRNTKVAAQDAFLPVFEAIVNSIHSIQDRFGLEDAAEKGCIQVHVHRVQQHQLPGVGRPPVEPVTSFTVVDNGVGFTDPNLKSFETADSTAKIERGGKGIGRLTWLVVFEKAEIESRFRDYEDRLRRMSFTFSPTETGISDFSDEALESEETIETRVRLVGVRNRYVEPLRKGLEVIAERVFEHCFNYFMVGNCPRVTVIEHGADGTSDLVVVNALTQELTISQLEQLKVGEHDLNLRHVQQRHASGKKHLGHLLANDRVVSSFPLADVSDLGADPIRGEQGTPLVHHAFVGGPALDSAADATRSSFVLPDGEPIHEASGLLDLKTLREEVGRVVNDQLKEVLEAERKTTLEKIDHHIRTEQPEYARLLEQKPDELARIKWTDNSRLIDEALYRVKQDWEFEIRQQRSAVEQKLVESETDVDELAEQLYRVVSETNRASQDDLVRYVLKRRAVLQLLQKLISRQENALEEHIHRIVFPLKRTNVEVDYEDHNLWLVDDTLSFYEFISSDLPLSKNAAAPSDSLERPDILAFKTGDPYQHVSIIEFKKPDRKDNENPVDQLVRYARRLRDGGSMDVNGVTIPGISKNIRIDGYAIVTLNPKMQSVLSYGPGEMKQVEGEWRWYGALSNLNMNVEVLDFRAFLSRARQRNQAFFKALSLR